MNKITYFVGVIFQNSQSINMVNLRISDSRNVAFLGYKHYVFCVETLNFFMISISGFSNLFKKLFYKTLKF